MLLVLVACISTLPAAEGSVLRAIENEIAGILESNREGVVRIHALYPRSRESSVVWAWPERSSTGTAGLASTATTVAGGSDSSGAGGEPRGAAVTR